MLVLASLVAAAAVGATTLLVLFGYSTTCGRAPTPADIWAGQRALLLLVGAALAPWAVATALVRRRRRVVVAGLVAAAPAVLALLLGLGPDLWRGSFCF